MSPEKEREIVQVTHVITHSHGGFGDALCGGLGCWEYPQSKQDQMVAGIFFYPPLILAVCLFLSKFLSACLFIN